IHRLKMMQMIRETHFDFVKFRVPAIAMSVIIIVIGLAAAGMRGKEIFDIDFTGGSSVNILLKEPMDIAQVREAVKKLGSEETEGSDVAVSSVGSDNPEYRDRQYKVDSGIRDLK